MKHVVQFSTGAGSAEVAYRVADQYDVDDMILLTADTMVEDPDNWRFASEVVDDLGLPRENWVILRDGRTPMQVGRDERVVPNNRMAVCSKLLKRKPLRQWINTNCDPDDTVIYMGFDWLEPERHDRALEHWHPYTMRSPLLEPPYLGKAEILATFREVRCIEPPRLYGMGFSHANCGGACVRGGQAQWELLLRVRPDTYAEWESEEQTTRDMLGKDVAILRETRDTVTTPLTLHRFRERLQSQPSLFDDTDWGACGCMEGPGA
jgi:hypothetical protein